MLMDILIFEQEICNDVPLLHVRLMSSTSPRRHVVDWADRPSSKMSASPQGSGAASTVTILGGDADCRYASRAFSEADGVTEPRVGRRQLTCLCAPRELVEAPTSSTTSGVDGRSHHLLTTISQRARSVREGVLQARLKYHSCRSGHSGLNPVQVPGTDTIPSSHSWTRWVRFHCQRRQVAPVSVTPCPYTF